MVPAVAVVKCGQCTPNVVNTHRRRKMWALSQSRRQAPAPRSWGESNQIRSPPGSSISCRLSADSELKQIFGAVALAFSTKKKLPAGAAGGYRRPGEIHCCGLPCLKRPSSWACLLDVMGGRCYLVIKSMSKIACNFECTKNLSNQIKSPAGSSISCRLPKGIKSPFSEP